MVTLEESLSLELVASRSEIARALDGLEEFAVRMGLDDSVSFNLYLAADEVLSNIIIHGYAEDGKGQILLSVVRGEEFLTLELSDSAAPFNPLDAPPPDLSLPLGQREPGGFGVYLTRKVVNLLEYRREGGKNVVTLKWKLDSTRG